MKSVSSRLIDAVIAQEPARVLRNAEYSKRGRRFWAAAGEVYKVVDFQLHRFNSADDARFTVNLQIVLPYVHESYLGEPMPKDVCKAVPAISQRLGFLMQERCDFWWQLTKESDVDSVSQHVAVCLEDYGLPFLDEHSKVDAMIKFLERHNSVASVVMNRELCLAMVLKYRGRTSEAKAIIERLRSPSRITGFSEILESVARRLGIE